MSEYLKCISEIRKDPDQCVAFYAERSHVVIAGPGSGKTFLLTAKAAKLLLEGQIRYPRKIACITFSRQLGDELVKKLRKLGVYDDGRMYVGTIHAFCIAEILMPAFNILPQDLCIPEQFRVASEAEKTKSIHDALRTQGKILPENDNDRKSIQNDLDKFRRRYFQPEIGGFSAVNLPEASEYSKQFLQDLDWSNFADDYHDILQRSFSSIDFVQIEMLALRIIRTTPRLIKTLAATYPWWLVDEYQDLSPLFHQMITYLVQSKYIQVFAIGDPNQCIYEDMQGSKPDSIYELAQTVKQAENSDFIKLRRNYRTPQNLIQVSDLVLGKGDNGYKSSTEEQGEFKQIKVQNSSKIIETIKALIDKRLGGNIGILTFSRKQKKRNGKSRFVEILDELSSLKYGVQADKDPDFDIKTELGEWLRKAAQWCSGEDVYFYDLLPFWKEFCQLQGDDQIQQIQAENELFRALWHIRDGNMLLKDWLETIQKELLIQSRLDAYRKLRPDDVDEFQKLVAATSAVPRLQNKTIHLFGKKDATILLTTFHSSKGLEFDTAIVIDLDRISESQSSPELDNRLAYVAVSRAKSRLYILVLNSAGKFARRLKDVSEMPVTQLSLWQHSER